MPKPLKICSAFLKNFVKNYRHFFWVLFVPLFIVCFAIVETVITTDYWVSYSRLDDFVPFVPEFVVFYFLWYPLLFIVGLYLLLRDASGYRRYMWALFTGLFVSLLFYVIVPNGQNLRPATFVENTFFTRIIGSLYSLDTNTNVIPSMHVIGTMVAAFAFFDAPGLKRARYRVFIVALATLINISTVLIKQHSVLDIFAGLAFSVPLYIIFYVFVKKRQAASRAGTRRRSSSSPAPD